MPSTTVINRIVAVGIVVASALTVSGQLAIGPTPDPLFQLMLTQPSIEVVTNPVAVAGFEPPVVRPGELSTYRVSVNALDESVQLPVQIAAPPGLQVRQSARGQVLLMAGNRLVPQTTINHHARASAAGDFTVAPFTVQVYGKPVTVPAARLVVVSSIEPVGPPARRLTMEVPTNEVFVGQSVSVRLLLSDSVTNPPQRLAQVRFNGADLLTDHAQARQTFAVSSKDGREILTSIYEVGLTPLVAGELHFTAQGFPSATFTGSAILIPSQLTADGNLSPELLLDSDPATLNVRPLPQTGVLPGFTGAIGHYACEPPRLSATQVQVGDTVRLSVTVRGEGNLARLVPPPPPASVDWQVAAPVNAGLSLPVGLGVPAASLRRGAMISPVATFVYSLVPLSPKITTTPVIPFSYFDPARAVYVDLSIAAMPIEVLPGTQTNAARLWLEAAAAIGETNHSLVLSDLASAPGRSARSYVPLQRHGWFMVVQVLPLIGFAGLWQWDRRRRYLEQHPDVVRRRQARRALRKERRALQKAMAAADPQRYAEAAVRCMRVACAPHFPAEPRALVCRDVLEVIGDSPASADVVRQFFMVVDARHFSTTATDAQRLLSEYDRLERVLSELEARL